MSPAAKIVLGCAVLAGLSLLLLGLVGVVYLISRPGGGDRQGLVVVQSEAAEAAPPQAGSSEAQALAMVKAHFDGRWLKQGDSWFAIEDEIMGQRSLIQVKGVSFKVFSEPTNQADKLNGLEWSGRVDYDATVSRRKPLQGAATWSNWENGFKKFSLYMPYYVSKSKGKWEMDAQFKSCRKPTAEELAFHLKGN